MLGKSSLSRVKPVYQTTSAKCYRKPKSVCGITYISAIVWGPLMPRILIADDSEFLRTHLRGFLQRPDWDICGEAANGRKAVLMASEMKPDLIVLDFAMPMLNGIEAAREILKAMPNVPIVLYTLHKNPQLELDANAAGIRKVISKGENSNALITTLQELIASSETPLKPIGPPPESSAKLRIVPNLVSDLQKQIPRKPAGHER
jgi:DNA-binding NarL/FixJ family response regulator